MILSTYNKGRLTFFNLQDTKCHLLHTLTDSESKYFPSGFTLWYQSLTSFRWLHNGRSSFSRKFLDVFEDILACVNRANCRCWDKETCSIKAKKCWSLSPVSIIIKYHHISRLLAQTVWTLVSLQAYNYLLWCYKCNVQNKKHLIYDASYSSEDQIMVEIV